MKACIFQITNNNTKPYSDISCKINKHYCHQNSYDYIELESKIYQNYHYTWSKIFQSIDLINTTKYDYYCFLDADVVIINHQYKLESIIDKIKTPIAFSKNGLNGGLLIATGGFIFTNNALNIFQRCIELSNTESLSRYKQSYWFEMAIINYMYENGTDMDILEMNELNSYGCIDINDPNLSNLFLYHFQGRSDLEKTKIANDVYQKFFKELI